MISKKELFCILDADNKDNTISRGFNIFIVALIVLNTFALILQSVDHIGVRYFQFFRAFEVFSVVIFSVEYVLRVWTSDIHKKYQGEVRGRVKYILSPMAIIDLMAILPFFLLVIPYDLRFLRLFRLFRILRILKLGRYSLPIKRMGAVLVKKKEDLIVTLSIVGFLILTSSIIMFYAENEAQPDVFSDIPSTMWWAVITLTTVGYGDVYPITMTGKVIGAVIAVLGIGMVALPAGILGSGFVDEMQEETKQKRKRKIRRLKPFRKRI